MDVSSDVGRRRGVTRPRLVVGVGLAVGCPGHVDVEAAAQPPARLGHAARSGVEALAVAVQRDEERVRIVVQHVLREVYG